MSTLRKLREDLADLLRDQVPGVNVYPHVPAAPMVPAVILSQDEPYLEPSTLGRDPVRVMVRLRVHVLVGMADNAGAQDRIEQLVVAVLAGFPSGWQVGPVSRAGLTTIGTTDVLETDLTVATTVTLPAEVNP
ncbi:MAG: hypothetical protein ACLFUG_11430 [Nitriliruptoraceae bacterium]